MRESVSATQKKICAELLAYLRDGVSYARQAEAYNEWKLQQSVPSREQALVVWRSVFGSRRPPGGRLLRTKRSRKKAGLSL